MTSSPDPLPPASPTTRTVRRIIVEAVFVALFGALALGILWELGLPDAGWTAAIIIWVAGAPVLEVVRLLQTRG